MRVYKNESFIKRRAKVGQGLFWIGLGILAVGMYISFRWPNQYPLVPTIPLIALVAGFITAQTGTYYLNRYVRPDRADISLTAALKGFSNNYALYHYLSPAAHVLVGPEACYVFVVKLQDGKVVIENGRGREPMTLRRLVSFFGRESVGDLGREAQDEVNALKRFTTKFLPDVELPVTPVVVFAHGQVQLEVKSSSVQVLHAKQLKDWLRGPGKAKGLAAQARTQLENLMGGQLQETEE